MPEFSVIIPSFNHGTYLERRIDSILQQTFTDFEIILIDDGSTDNSRIVAQKYLDHPKFSMILFNENNSGSPFKLWEKGIALAKGSWIWIAESDDMAEPNFLEEAAKAIHQQPSLDIFYSDSYVIDENDKISEKFSERKNKVFQTQKWSASYLNKGIEEINECLKYDCTVNNMSSAVLRKTHIAAIAKETGTFRFHGDWYLMIRACPDGIIGYCNKPLNYYRIHSASHSIRQTLLGSRYECFKILHLLYYHPQVTEKKALLDHFTYNCLGFGIIRDGPVKGWKIFSSYWEIDKKLALKVFINFISIKISRKKRPFFIPANIKNYSYQH